MAIPPVEAPVPVEAAAPPEPAPATAPPAAPWQADIAAALAAPDPAAALDEYMRTKQQPYITKLEAERTAALDKAWVFDSFNDDPAAALAEVAAQVWGDDVAGRMAELVAAGATPEDAEEQAVTEAVTEADGALDLSKLPPEVREAVEFAQSEKAAKAEAETAKTAADAQAAAEAEYMTWYDKTVADNADLKSDKARANALHAYVAAADDMEAGLAAFRADFPAPAAPEAPVTLGGGASTGGIQPARPSGGSFADVMGGVWDAMAGTAPR